MTLFEQEFSCEKLNVYKEYSERIYQSILEGERYPNPENVNGKGYSQHYLKEKDNQINKT